MRVSREIVLKRRPVGLPTADDFELIQVPLPAPGAGQVQVRNLWLSVDPYMRSRMNAGKSYMPQFDLGKTMTGGAVGEIVISNDASLKPGDKVLSMFGWRERFNADARDVRKLDAIGLPPQAFLGVAGMVGLTAYVGLLRIAGMKADDVVFVSAAAGAVGSVACQVAKIHGCTVIGSAGGAAKTAFVRELGVDHVIDYKAEPDLTAALRKATPGGIDVYFENVGGAHLEAALHAAKDFARFAMCGMIADYNATPAAGPANLFLVIAKSIRLQGFLVRDHFDLLKQCQSDVARWHAAGRLQWRETVEHGLEHAVSAFLKLFDGRNVGKMLVRLD